MFFTSYGTSGTSIPGTITSLSSTTFTYDPQYGNSNKGIYMWVAIGISSN